METIDQLCNVKAAACQCLLKKGHPPPHRCLDPRCEGEWLGGDGPDDGEFAAILLPKRAAMLFSEDGRQEMAARARDRYGL